MIACIYELSSDVYSYEREHAVRHVPLAFAAKRGACRVVHVGMTMQKESENAASCSTEKTVPVFISVFA